MQSQITATRQFHMKCSSNIGSNTLKGTLGWPCLQVQVVDQTTHPLSWNSFVGIGIQDRPVPPAIETGMIPCSRKHNKSPCLGAFTHTHTHTHTHTNSNNTHVPHVPHEKTALASKRRPSESLRDTTKHIEKTGLATSGIW